MELHGPAGQGETLLLPQTSAGPLSEKPSQLTLSIGADGAVYLRNQRVADANLRDLLIPQSRTAT